MTYRSVKRLLKVSSHLRNANQNNDKPPRTDQNGRHQGRKHRPRGEENPRARGLGMSTGALIMENSMERPQEFKKKNQKKYDPAHLLVDTHIHVCMCVCIPQGNEQHTGKRHVCFHVHRSFPSTTYSS